MKATDEADEADEADGDCTANVVSFIDFNPKTFRLNMLLCINKSTS